MNETGFKNLPRSPPSLQQSPAWEAVRLLDSPTPGVHPCRRESSVHSKPSGLFSQCSSLNVHRAEGLVPERFLVGDVPSVVLSLLRLPWVGL